jgi:hypothetical protein
MYVEVFSQHRCAPPHTPSHVDALRSVEQRDTKIRAKGNLEEINKMTGLCAEYWGEQEWIIFDSN